MPTTLIIDGSPVVTYTDAERVEGLTKARIAANIARVGTSESQFATDAEYSAFVTAAAGLINLPTSAMDSYASLFAAKTVYDLEVELSNAIIASGDVATPPATPPTIAGVPQRISMRQARLALFANGLLSTVNDAILSLPSPQKETAQIEWEYATYLDRSNSLVTSLGTALNLTSTQLDALFIAASQL